MREGCGCGAWIHGRRKDVLTWRTTHRHDGQPEEPQFEHRDNDGTMVESTGPFYRDDSERVIPDIQLGFQPNN